MVLDGTSPIRGEEGSERLVVLVHGWGGGLFPTKDVEETIRTELRNADLMVPRYRSHITANTDPIEVAEALSEAIEHAVQARHRAGEDYRDIILVGFSLGALVARKAYVFARGQVQDSSTPFLQPHSEWANRVSRIVLLAGVNRGWSMSPKPKHLLWSFWLMYRLLYPLSAVFPIGRLIRSFQRGMPFVANLRIQWQNLEQQPEPLPTTIQLLGKEEDLVSLEDNVDIQFCKRFVFLSVPETGHFNAMNFHQRGIGPRRREIFVQALLEENLQGDFLPTPELDPRNERILGHQPSEVSDVVFVMHGIRDFGHWTHNVRDCIDCIALKHRRRVFVNTSAYTRFPMSGFLFSMFRRAKIRWFMDKYSEAYARHPRARFHFIGHSNGTYLLAGALKRYQACRFERVAFAGSVVPRNFPWDKMVRQQRVKNLRNDLASGDWVVAIFPRFFEQLREVLRLPVGDIGSSGVCGFQDNEGNKHQVAYVEGGHGAAIAPENHPSLVRYVLGIDASPKPDAGVRLATQLAPWVSRCTCLCGFIWLLLVLLPLTASAAATYIWYGAATQGWQLDGLVPWLASCDWYPLLIPAAVVALILAWILSTV